MNKLLFIILFISQLGYANNGIEISILTCSPGQEIYSAFGHTAIRIIDQDNATDKVYNFGIFNFGAPNFTYNFVKAKLQYDKSVENTAGFIDDYTSENRLVSEQTLNLTIQEKNKFMEQLAVLYLPQNKKYVYGFLKKNCSTETRDLLRTIGINFQRQNLKETNRDLINGYLNNLPWLRLGIHLILGQSLDMYSTHFQSMFLPDYLRIELRNTYLNGRVLVKSEQDLNVIEIQNDSSVHIPYLPLFTFSVLFVILLFWFPKSLRILLCLAIGLTGLLMTTMWLFSGHPEVKTNLNILWCNPLYLLYIPLLIQKKSNKILNIIVISTWVASICIWLLEWQVFDVAVAPLLLIIGLFHFKIIRRKKLIYQGL
ncbi:MAG: DUF4105 domain-containing protein [Crocinitomicaceae bacterium]